MRTLSKTLLSLTGVAGLTGVASGNAFNINEHDAKVTGRGGASAATNTDPSSIIFNPGGIPVAEGTQVSIGSSLYIAQGTYEPDGGGAKTKTDSSPAIVPSIYITSRVHDMIAVGIGFHLPFGLSTSWPTGHAQADVIQDQSLRTYFITPSVGINLYKQVPGLSIGGGVDIVPATVKLERAVNFGDPANGGAAGTGVIGGDALGIGGRAGVMYHPPKLKALKLGVMWRSKVKLDFTGKSDFDIAAPYRDRLPPDGNIDATITLPMSVAGGVAYSPIPALELELNAVWIDWSTFQELRINLQPNPTTGAPNATVLVENYKDTVSFRIGAEYQVNEKASVRAGFIYDPTPIPTTTLTAQLPDVDRKNITVGGSYNFGKVAAHLALLWVTPGKRDTSDVDYMPNYKGTYGVQALVASLMVTGHFGGEAKTAAE